MDEVKINKDEYFVLKHLYDDKSDSSRPPYGMSDELYVYILSQMEAKNWIRVVWCEGHSVYDVYLLTAKAIMELFLREFEKSLKTLLQNSELDVDMYKVLANLNNGYMFKKDVEHMSDDEHYDILSDLETMGLVAYAESADDVDRITHKGKKLVSDIETAYFSTSEKPNDVKPSGKYTYQQTAILFYYLLSDNINNSTSSAVARLVEDVTGLKSKKIAEKIRELKKLSVDTPPSDQIIEDMKLIANDIKTINSNLCTLIKRDIMLFKDYQDNKK